MQYKSNDWFLYEMQDRAETVNPFRTNIPIHFKAFQRSTPNAEIKGNFDMEWVRTVFM